MTESIWQGLLIVIAGGAMQGSFALPQKFLRGWAWEKGWLVYSIAAMTVFPWLTVALTIPGALGVYSSVSGGVLARTALFGAGWGVGSVLFGLGMAKVGIALAFAVIISLTAAVGSLVPLLVLQPGEFFSARGALLMLGLAVVILGVTLVSKAGAMKQGEGQRKAQDFKRGLLICVASGLTSPMMNFSFAFGGAIGEEAVRRGADPAGASVATFAVAVSAGFFINAGYCLYLMRRNPAPKPEGRAALNVLLASAMGFLWLYGFVAYGRGSSTLGTLGTVLAWPIFMTVMVMVANLWGLVTGEWKTAPPAAMRRLAAGLVVLILALVIISAGARA